MGRKFFSEKEIKEVIKESYHIEPVAGMIFELCWVRNFRAQDVRNALGSHFKKDNGYPYFYLKDDKTKTDEWYPIPLPIYNKIEKHINGSKIGPGDPVFVITKRNPGNYHGHTGIISRNWLIKIWYKSAKEVSIYTEEKVITRSCKGCPFSLPNKKCNVLGDDKIRNRDNVHINHCKNKGVTRIMTEAHPRIHESLRAGGAIAKIRYFMKVGDDYSTAKAKVFHQSNWRSWPVYNRYMDIAFEKLEGDKEYKEHFLDLTV